MKFSSYLDERGWTDAEMARLIGGCSAGAVKKWRYGERVPRGHFLLRIREVTEGQVTADDFVPSPENENEAAA